MGFLSLMRDDRTMIVGLSLATVGVFVGMRAVLQRFRDASEIKPVPPKLRYITQETEDALPDATLYRLLSHYNYSIRETATKIVCDRAVNDPNTLQTLIRGISRPSYDERMKNLRALSMLMDLNTLHLLDMPAAYSAFVRSLELCVGDSQYDMIDDEFFDEYYLRDISEKLCLMFLDHLVRNSRHGVERLVRAGFVERWLVRQRWGADEDQSIHNFSWYLRCRGNRIADICKCLCDSIEGFDALERARLVRPHGIHRYRHYRHHGCRGHMCLRDEEGEESAGERMEPSIEEPMEQPVEEVVEEHVEVVEEQQQSPEGWTAVQARQQGQATQEEQRIRRQHREAMVLNDGTRPLRRGDIIERESE